MSADLESPRDAPSLAAQVAGDRADAPAQLVEAHGAWAQAMGDLAGGAMPHGLVEARAALDQANAEFEVHGETVAMRDYAYIAKRKLQLAEVQARTDVARAIIAEAAKLGVVVGGRAGRSRRFSDANYVGAANGRPAPLRPPAPARSVAPAAILETLAAFATVTQGPCGLVVTLSTAAFFARGQRALRDSVAPWLDQLARALVRQPADKQMMVEGHAESEDADQPNLPLLRARALVGNLVSRGVDANRISAVRTGSILALPDCTRTHEHLGKRGLEIVLHTSRVIAL